MYFSIQACFYKAGHYFFRFGYKLNRPKGMIRGIATNEYIKVISAYEVGQELGGN